jgi:hypothetical protein
MPTRVAFGGSRIQPAAAAGVTVGPAGTIEQVWVHLCFLSGLTRSLFVGRWAKDLPSRPIGGTLFPG